MLVNEQILEHLPYVDIPINDNERHHVEQLVQRQLQQNHPQQLHPMVDSLVPLPSPNSMQNEIRMYEDDQSDEEDHNEECVGVNVNDYESHKLLENLYYNMNHETDLSLVLENSSAFQTKLSQVDLSGNLQSQISKKRKQIDDLNNERNKRQVSEFNPIKEYLESKWEDGMKTIVDLSIEASKTTGYR